jgi:thiamine-monophosphate kinase
VDEFGFIASLLRPLTQGAPEALGLRDDAALIKPPAGMTLVITKDAISAGVHCIGDEPAGLIARKLLRANLSDLAAMGAAPYGYFLALLLPATTDEAWLHDFAAGLRADQEAFGITLMGGDTTRTHGPLALSATLLGLVPDGQALLRGGAKDGDSIYVSGTLGDGAMGLKVAQQDAALAGLGASHRAYLLERYRLPQPRIAWGQALRGVASACMDISDGLVQDLGHLCAASGVGAVLEAASVPLSEAAQAALALVPAGAQLPLIGGDDYELLFTVPQAQDKTLHALAKECNVRVTRVGRMTHAQQDVRVLDMQGEALQLTEKGYRHNIGMA